MPFITTAAIVGGTLAAGIGGSAIAAHAGGKAADKQVQAAESAALLQKQAADEALAYQKEKDAQEQKNLAPWLETGKNALGQLSDLMKPGGQLTQQFQAPTTVDEQNDPGFQFRLQEGQKALERSAAARGNLLTGATAKGINDYAQNSASSEYGNVYNRAFNEFQTNQANTYNRLAGLAGTGQTAANTLGAQGQASAGNVGNILINSGQQQGNAVENAGAARASGYINSANSWNNGLTGAAGGITQAYLLKNLLNPGSPSSGALPVLGNPNGYSSVYG